MFAVGPQRDGLSKATNSNIARDFEEVTELPEDRWEEAFAGLAPHGAAGLQCAQSWAPNTANGDRLQRRAYRYLKALARTSEDLQLAEDIEFLTHHAAPSPAVFEYLAARVPTELLPAGTTHAAAVQRIRKWLQSGNTTYDARADRFVRSPAGDSAE